MLITKEQARAWLDKAEALIKEDLQIRSGSGDVDYNYEGSVAQLLKWTTTVEGYATIMNSLNPIFRVNEPIDKMVTFRPENRKRGELFNLLLNVYEHSELLRIGKFRLLVSHDYPSTIVKRNEFKHEFMNNLYRTGLTAYIALTPIAPYASTNSGIITALMPLTIVDHYTRFFGKADGVDFEEAADIHSHSAETMLAITLARYDDKLDYYIAKAFHEASAEKHGFRNLSDHMAYNMGSH